jgi:hypothetical protein
MEDKYNISNTDTNLSGYSDEFLARRVNMKPFAEYDEDTKRCIRRTHETYFKNPTPPKQYIDLDVGFFGLCSYQPQAWEHVFKSIRKVYSDAPIVLINDGAEQFDYSDMARRYKCMHMKREHEICLHWYKIEYMYEYWHRLKASCDLAKTEWLVHLHPDVICCDKISKYPPSPLAGVSCGSFTGVSKNAIGQKTVDFIRQFQPNVEINGYGWCGGSIIHVPTFLEIYDSIINKKNWDLFTLRDQLGQHCMEHEDQSFSILFALHGYPYRIWLDNPEATHGYMGYTDAGAFLHGYKKHYNLKEGENIESYFRRCREENAKNQGIGQADGFRI